MYCDKGSSMLENRIVKLCNNNNELTWRLILKISLIDI